MLSILLAGVSGLVLVLAYPPYGWAILVVPSVAGLLHAVRRAPTAGTAWGAGAAFGVVFFSILFPWIGELGGIALVPLVTVQAAFPTVYARVLWSARDWPAGFWMVGAVTGWGLMEFARDRFPVGGFAWGMIGYPAGEYAATRNAAQWIGTSGWSLVLVALAAGWVLSWGYRHRGWISLRWGVGPTTALVLLAAAGAAFPPVPDGREVRAAIVQGSTPCPAQRCAGERAQIYERHLALTASLPSGSVDLVVWPEGSTGFSVDPVLDPAIGAAMGDQAARIGAVLLAGGDRPVSETEWINANVVFDTEGTIVGEYRKRHPVPFGEYVPARPLFGWIRELERVPRDMIRGDGPVVFDPLFGPFGSVISFESSFARYGRDTVRAGADLLVVATSQASYPFSDASDQLIGMTRMRAAELGVDVLHGGVTGRSAIIVDGGEIADITELVEATVLVGTVHMRAAGPTLYTLLGDWLQIIGVAVLVALVTYRHRATRRSAEALEPDQLVE